MKLILRLNGFELESESELDEDLIKHIGKLGVSQASSSLRTDGKRKILLTL